MRVKGLIALVFVITCLPAAGTCGEAAASAVSKPVVISKPELQRPLNDLREALIYVRFLVSPQGQPTQVEVQEDRGFHNEAYRKVAMKFVQGMRFKPAEKDGVPVEYGPLIQPLDFGFGLPREEQGVTPQFRYELNKVEKLLKKGDFSGANFHAEWMLSEKVKYNYEFAVLQAALAQTNAAAGNEDAALNAVLKATSRKASESPGFKLRQPAPANDASNYLLPRDLVVSLLYMRMQLLARKGQVLAALKTYDEMAGLVNIKAGDARAALAETLTALLEGGSALAFPAQVRGEFWSHELFRREFTVRNVDGDLGIIHLHCRGEYTEHSYAPGAIWSLPDGWEGCVVEFYGEPGTKFELVELPPG